MRREFPFGDANRPTTELVSEVPEIALYYPYIDVRDDNWLKAAALYWPRLARLAPPEYTQHDSDVARALADELGFFLDIEPPATQVLQVGKEFLEFVYANQERIRTKYNSVTNGNGDPLCHEVWLEMLRANSWRPGSGGWIHVRKMTGYLRRELVRLGLGDPAEDDRNWLIVHPALSAAYTMVLVDRVAQANDLAVVTDQPMLHEIHNSRTGGEFESTLFCRWHEGDDHANSATDVATMYASIAIQAIVPEKLENIPISKIIKARCKLAAEFDIFREHLDTLAQEFEAIAAIENPTVLQARLQLLVDRDLRRPAAALERSLRQLGLEPAKAVLGLKTLELPAIAAAASSAAGVPVAAGQAGLVTARLIAAGIESQSKRRAARQSGPAGYLLGLQQQLKPGRLERLIRSMRHGATDR